MKYIYTVILLFFLISFSSCSKFSEGPKLSIRTVKSRVSGNWQIVSYTINEVDSLPKLTYDKITIGDFIKVYRKDLLDNEYRYDGAIVTSYPEGVEIGTILIPKDKKTLSFLGPISDLGGHVISTEEASEMNFSALTKQYFLYQALNWLGVPTSKLSVFTVEKLKENNMKLISTYREVKPIKYEFKKIK